MHGHTEFVEERARGEAHRSSRVVLRRQIAERVSGRGGYVRGKVEEFPSAIREKTAYRKTSSVSCPSTALDRIGFATSCELSLRKTAPANGSVSRCARSQE